jgi:hypothetical protein
LTKNKYGGYECLDLPDGTMQCFGNPGVLPPADEPEITPGDILTAVKEIGLPSLTVNIQPDAATLVNFDTIFYAQPKPFACDIDLLGYRISLRATPIAYRWQHGDGTSHTTAKPGRPYPAKDVTYKYKEPAKHVHPSVDVTYAVRYRVDGGSWQSLRQTLQASGPAADLEVKEAIPVLAAG